MALKNNPRKIKQTEFTFIFNLEVGKLNLISYN